MWGGRLARWLRWCALPWRPAGTAALLVAALALPTTFVLAGRTVAEGAADQVTAAVVGEADPSLFGVDVRTLARATGEPPDVGRAMAALDRAAERLRGPMGGDDAVHEQWLSTSPRLTVRATEGPATRVRIVASDGTTARLGGGDGSPGAGVWLPAEVAAELGVAVGDPLLLTEFDVRGATTLAGILDDPEDLDLPAELQPPTTGFPTPLALAEPEDLLATGLPLRGLFAAEPTALPTTRRALDAALAQVDDVRSLVGLQGPLLAALTVLAGGEDPGVRVDTPRRAVNVEVRIAQRAAEDPFRLAERAAMVVAAALALGGLVPVARRHRRVVRLVVDDGAHLVTVALVGAVLAIPPVVAGTALALVLGPLLAGLVVDTAAVPVPTAQVAGVAALLVAAAGATCARMASRADRELPGRSRIAAVIGTGLVVAAVGSAVWLATTDPSSTLPPAALVFPLATLGGVAVLGVAALGVVTRNLPERGGRLDPRILLAWRRLAAPTSGANAAASGLAAALGLVVFAGALVPTLQHAGQVATALRIGGEGFVDTGRVLVDLEPDEVPSGATVVASAGREVVGRRGTVTVHVVDPTGWADVVSWFPSYADGGFGTSADEVAAALQAGSGTDALGVVVVGPLPAAGTLQLGGGVPYEVVGRLRAAPLMAPGRTTVLVAADHVDRAGRAAWRERALRVADTVEEAVEAGLAPYRSPVGRFSTRVVGDLAALRQVMATAVLPGSAELVTDLDPTDRAARLGRGLALQFLLVVALVVLGAALLAVGLLLAERRRRTRVADLMLATMGMSTAARRTSLAVELAVLLGVVAGLGAATGLVLARVVAGLLTPDANLPLPLSPRLPVVLVVAVAAGWPLVSLGGALFGASRRSVLRGEVLRGAA